MAAERFTNGAQTTLFAAIDDASETLTVANASGFPGSGNFRIRIDNELMLVTAVSGTSWTVTREVESTTAAAHSSGATVVQVLTAGALETLGGGGTGTGTELSVLGVAGPDPGARADIAADGTQSVWGVLTHSPDIPGLAWVYPAFGHAGEPGFVITDGTTGPLFMAFPLAVANGGTGATSAADARTNLGLGTAAVLASDTDGALSTNSDSRVATQKAVKTYVDTSVTGLLDFKGNLSASANPNYPAASKGDAYYVSAAGKVGGASGKSVEVGDVVIASADNAGGTEASVGSSWFVIEHNLVGALLASNNLSDLSNASTARTNLGLGTLATQSGTFSGGGTLATGGFTLTVGATASISGAHSGTSSGTNTGDQTITLTGDVTGSGSGSFAASIGSNKVTDAMLRPSAALSLIGRGANSTGNVADIVAASDGQVVRRSGTALGFGAVDLANANAVTGTLPSSNLPAAVTGAVVPAGALLAFARTSAPTGWLACDGSAVSRTTYANLFTAIGTVWGSGDGSTTFNLPDFRRRVAVGSGGTGTGTLGNAVGNTGGAEAHTLSVGEMPAHSHPLGLDAVTGTNPGSAAAGHTATVPYYTAPFSPTTVGGGGAHNNMQPSAVVLMCIKT